MKYQEKAKQFAYQAHKGQFRRDGVTPYITHPMAVAEILRKQGINDDAILSAALLHDVVEDCSITLDEIMQNFGPRITRLVDGMTQRKSEESDESYRRRIIANDDEVRMIKLADVLHNMLTTTNIPDEKNRAKTFRSMHESWTDYKGFAYDVNRELAERIQQAYEQARMAVCPAA